MASEEKKALEELLKPCLREAGFKKRGGTWHKPVQAGTQVVSLQGSQFSKIFYVNLGVYLSFLGTKARPAGDECHVRCRLSEIVEDSSCLSKLLDLHSFDFDDIDRSALPHLLRTHGLPWLNRCSTKEGLHKELEYGTAQIEPWNVVKVQAYSNPRNVGPAPEGGLE